MKTKIGKIAITPKGEYSSAATYNRLDAVSYKGNSYIVLKPCSGVTPCKCEFYALLAEGGKDGKDGDRGEQGKSAYELWLEQGHEGTEAEFIASLSYQSDIAENDTTSAAYIKHSEGYGYFGETKVERVDLVPETSVEISDATGRYMAGTDSPAWVSPISLESGKVYKVLFADALYSCAAHVYSDEGIAWLGNMGAFDSTMPNTGEPFLYLCSLSGDIDGTTPVQICSEEARGKTVSFSIFEEAETREVKHFSHEIMPKGYGGFAENITLLPETDLFFNSPLQGWQAAETLSEPMMVGYKYTVSINGAEYTGVANAYAMGGLSCVGFGNTAVVGGENTGEPFFALTMYDNGNYYFGVADLSGATAVRASLVKNVEITLFDVRLIGDWVARKKLGTVELLPEITFEWVFDEDSGDYNYSLNQPVLLEFGKEYKVVLNGNTYQCIGTNVSNICVLDVGGQLMVALNGATILLLADEINVFEPATIAIYAEGEVPDKMPEEYLPENITASDVVLTSPSGKQFKLTVDDSGNLTATDVAE